MGANAHKSVYCLHSMGASKQQSSMCSVQASAHKLTWKHAYTKCPIKTVTNPDIRGHRCPSIWRCMSLHWQRCLNPHWQTFTLNFLHMYSKFYYPIYSIRRTLQRDREADRETEGGERDIERQTQREGERIRVQEWERGTAWDRENHL